VKCWIYFARHGSDGPIKIGRTYDPARRLGSLSIGTPVTLELLGALLSDRAEEEEAEIHARLQQCLIRGEWFTAEGALQEMKALKAQIVAPDKVFRLETPNDSLAVNLNIRAAPEELALWKEAACRAGMTFSKWIREALNGISDTDGMGAEDNALEQP